MALPDFSMRQLLEAGAHFGHQSHRWNPKMSTYIFGTRNNIHVIDLAQTVPLLHRALQAVSDTVAKGGRVLFVGTKRQAADAIAEAAKRSAQYYVNSRWLGGMLTNWKTISASINRLRTLEETLTTGGQGLTKKERLMLSREKEKLDKALGGIKDMGGVPSLIFVIDTNKESLAIKEAQRLNIPVAAIVDTNCDPDGIAFPVPANDDAGRAITLYCDLIARAALDGIGRSQGFQGLDIGASEEPMAEELPAPANANEPAAEPAGEAEPAAAAESDAAEAEPTEAFELLAAPRGAPDDLTKLTGVGPQVDKKLNDAGIFHYWQVAAMKPEDVVKMDHDLKLNGPDRPRRLDRTGPQADRSRLTAPDHRTRRIVRSRRLAGFLLFTKGRTDGDDHRRDGEGSAREDRRGHDGLQERAERGRRRDRGRDRLAAQEGSGQGRQEGGPNGGRGVDRRGEPGALGHHGGGQF